MIKFDTNYHGLQHIEHVPNDIFYSLKRSSVKVNNIHVTMFLFIFKLIN